MKLSPTPRTLVALAAIALIGIAGFGAWWAVTQPLAPLSGSLGPITTEPVTVAWSPYESTALFWTAEDRRFFAGNGVCVTLRRYESAAWALDGVVNGEAEVAVAPSEYPLVRQAFSGADVRAIGCIDRGEFDYLVVRSDRGIRNVSDLRGRRVGFPAGTLVEFHLARFLALHGVNRSEVALVDLPTPAEWVNAAADGVVDAVASPQPYTDAARARLGADAVAWPIQNDQPLYALVVADGAWLRGRPETARRFLASLADAEQYLAAHRTESMAIVQERLALDPGYMGTVWRQNQFSLSLDESLLAAMKDEARWMIANNMTNATTIPDVRAYIDQTPLAQVRPDAVRLIG